MDATLLLTGLAVGLLVGLTATGGGAVLTPWLVLGLGVPARVAVGTDLLVAAAMKFAAGGAYAARGAVDWRTVRRLAAGSVPGVLAGAALAGALPDAAVARAVGGAVVLAGLGTLRRLARPTAPAPNRPPGPWATAGLGAGVGVLVGATSIGGGSVLLAVLAAAWPLPAATLVGTDVVHGLLLAVTGAALHGIGGRVELALVAPLVVGGVAGAVAGARLATRVPERALRTGLAGVLVVTGTALALGAGLGG